MPSHLLGIAAGLLAACGMLLMGEAAARPPLAGEEPVRYQYRPVETQHFDVHLLVNARYTISGEETGTRTRIDAAVRVIPFKLEKNGDVRLMAMIEDGTLVRESNGEKDSTDMRYWVAKRIELVMNRYGVIKQNLDIEHPPDLHVPGFAPAEDNGVRVLLSTLFPRLPGKVIRSRGMTLEVSDSMRIRYPDKVVVRKWKERSTFLPAARIDSISRFTYTGRRDATESIFPKDAPPARLTEDRITSGTFGISASGKLEMHDRKITIYRIIRPERQNAAESIEETTEITYLIHKK